MSNFEKWSNLYDVLKRAKMDNDKGQLTFEIQILRNVMADMYDNFTKEEVKQADDPSFEDWVFED